MCQHWLAWFNRLSGKGRENNPEKSNDGKHIQQGPSRIYSLFRVVFGTDEPEGVEPRNMAVLRWFGATNKWNSL